VLREWVKLTAAFVVVAVVAIVVVAGSSASAPSARGGDCGPNTTPSRDGTKVLGRVFFGGSSEPGWEQGDATRRDRWRRGRWFTKVGLLVRGDEPVVLELPAHKPIEFIGWFGEERSKTRTIDLTLSQPCGERDWQFDAGGFIYAGRHCAKVDVTADGRTKRIPFGLAKDCDR
jgi:hypothetical protein